MAFKSKYSTEQKTQLVGEFEKSDDKKRFAIAHGIPIKTLYGWRKKVSDFARKAKKAPVAVKAKVSNGHNIATVFGVFRAVEREIAKIPKDEALEVINYVRARLTGERAG